MGASNQFLAWLTVNSIALLALVFHAGRMFNRLENVEKVQSDLEEKMREFAVGMVTVAVMGQKVDSMGIALNKLSDANYALQQTILDLFGGKALAAKGRGGD